MATSAERAELVSLIEHAVDDLHDLRTEAGPLEVGGDRYRLDIAGPQDRVARVQEPIDDRRVGDDPPLRVLGHDVDARPDRLPVAVPRLIEGRHAQVGQR